MEPTNTIPTPSATPIPTHTQKLIPGRAHLKISEITIGVRMREDYGDLTSLKDSILRHGLIQPIVITPQNALVAGGRRLQSHIELGFDVIEFAYSDQLPEDIKEELEFEENFHRKQMTWQEECLGILSIYRKKRLQGLENGFEENWHLIISQMFKISIGNVNYILRVAQKLVKEKDLPEDKRRYWNFDSAAEAYRLGILADQEDTANKELARRQAAAATAQSIQDNKPQPTSPNTDPSDEQTISEPLEETSWKLSRPYDELDVAEQKRRYELNPLNVVPFEEYIEIRKTNRAQKEANSKIIRISNSLIQCNCIDFMMDPGNKGRFDHIITDPPYAIDMDNLKQDGSGMVDIDRVEDAHQVDENLTLLNNFFPAAYHCTKDKSFVITFCDISVWDFMYQRAIAAGFAVQRWPYIWRKVNQSTMNQAAGYNTTKDYEVAMICRKPGTTLFNKRNTSFTDASNNEVTKLTGHPFAKPFELTHDLVTMVAMEGQSILEPFAGGGSMVIQMLRDKMNVIGLEKETHHYNSLLENVKNLYYLKIDPMFKFA